MKLAGAWANSAPLPSAALATVLYVRAMQIRETIANDAEAAPRMILRPLTAGDADEAAELIRTAFAAQSRPTRPPSSALRETAQAIAAKIAAGGGFGVFEAGALIAVALWGIEGDALHVARVSVAPKRRGPRDRPLADRGVQNGGESPRRRENDAQDAAGIA